MNYTEFSNQPEYSGHFWNAMKVIMSIMTRFTEAMIIIPAPMIYLLHPPISLKHLLSRKAFSEILPQFLRHIRTATDYLTKRFAVNFADAEDKTFICGSGVDEPTGILNDGNGAEVGTTAAALTYDDVISLYFSIKPKYRKKAVWLMNDNTTMALRKLKDKDGNYLWNSNNDTTLGKQVFISEYMPDAGTGAKPIAFGDFSYYWTILRKRISVRSLTEKFALNNQIGYLAFEFLDGKLIRRDAVKVLQIS